MLLSKARLSRGRVMGCMFPRQQSRTDFHPGRIQRFPSLIFHDFNQLLTSKLYTSMTPGLQSLISMCPMGSAHVFRRSLVHVHTTDKYSIGAKHRDQDSHFPKYAEPQTEDLRDSQHPSAEVPAREGWDNLRGGPMATCASHLRCPIL